jgi:hypothetical protein
MAHFYFDVCTNGVTVEDEDGVDLLNAATALLEAVPEVAEARRNRAGLWNGDWTIEPAR